MICMKSANEWIYYLYLNRKVFTITVGCYCGNPFIIYEHPEFSRLAEHIMKFRVVTLFLLDRGISGHCALFSSQVWPLIGDFLALLAWHPSTVCPHMHTHTYTYTVYQWLSLRLYWISSDLKCKAGKHFGCVLPSCINDWKWLWLQRNDELEHIRPLNLWIILLP